MNINLNIQLIYQDEGECGVACLEMVFDFFKINFSHKVIIKATEKSLKGGDWYFMLGKVALDNDLRAEIVTRSTRIFDPSWFHSDKDCLIDKLKLEGSYFNSQGQDKIWEANEAMAAAEFLGAGGGIKFEAITPIVIENYLKRGIPVICPINANLIAPGLVRRIKYSGEVDDIKGEKIGHVILVTGMKAGKFLINDPGGEIMKISNTGKYLVDKNELVESILRGDMHLLVVSKK